MSVKIPRISEPIIIYAFRDISSEGEFTWFMNYTFTPSTQADSDTLTFEFGQEWPAGKLKEAVIDYMVVPKSLGLQVVRLRIESFQTHFEPKFMDLDNPHLLLFYPVSFSNFELTSGFTYMIVPEARMYPIHYMHMHNGRMDH